MVVERGGGVQIQNQVQIMFQGQPRSGAKLARKHEVSRRLASELLTDRDKAARDKGAESKGMNLEEFTQKECTFDLQASETYASLKTRKLHACVLHSTSFHPQNRRNCGVPSRGVAKRGVAKQAMAHTYSAAGVRRLWSIGIFAEPAPEQEAKEPEKVVTNE